MQSGTNFLLRFIDLGLLLLMSFFVIADLRQPFQSPLPQTGSGEGDDDVAVTLYYVQFSGGVVANIFDTQDQGVCHAATFVALKLCLAGLGTGDDVLFQLDPLQDATVQHYIHIVDVCADTGVECIPPDLQSF